MTKQKRYRRQVQKIRGQEAHRLFLSPGLLLLYTLISCNSAANTINQKNMSKEIQPKVTGIGGIFFKSDDPGKLMNWYGEQLGLAIDDYGSPFEFRNANRPDEINYLRWGPFTQETDYFDPSNKDFMINYRVQNIEGLVARLKANGAQVVDEIQEYEYGKFVHILDPEGTKIELWEPVDSVFTAQGGETTK